MFSRRRFRRRRLHPRHAALLALLVFAAVVGRLPLIVSAAGGETGGAETPQEPELPTVLSPQAAQPIKTLVSSAPPLTEREFKTAFAIFDRDDSGSLTRSEFDTAQRQFSLPLSAKELSALFEKLDDDESGTIDEREFMHLLA